MTKHGQADREAPLLCSSHDLEAQRETLMEDRALPTGADPAPHPVLTSPTLLSSASSGRRTPGACSEGQSSVGMRVTGAEYL